MDASGAGKLTGYWQDPVCFFYIFIFVAIHDLTYDTIELIIYYLSIWFLFSCGYLVQRWTGQHRYWYTL